MANKDYHKRRDLATAYHEAGHAVVGLHGRIKLKRITIIPQGRALGVCHQESILKGLRLDIDESPSIKDRVERTIRCLLGGPIAQSIYRRSSWRSWHGSSDYHEVADHVFSMVGSKQEAQAYLRLLEIQTEQMLKVKVRWIEVQAVAKALMVRKTLTGPEFYSVVDSAILAAAKRAAESQRKN